MNVIALPSLARTANATSAPINGSGHQGMAVVLDVTAVTLTPSITLSVEGWDKASNTWFTVLTGAAVTAAGTTVYRVHPALTAVANATAADMVPATFRVSVAHGDADSITYSVGVNLN